MSNTQTTPAPQPGFYPNIDFERYLEWDAVSSSRLRLASKSPAHYLVGFQGEPTRSMSLGTLCHAGVLEPLQIIQRFTFMPDYSKDSDNQTAGGERSFSKATKYVKEREELFRSVNREKTIIAEDDYNRMIGIATALSGCDRMRSIMKHGQSEVSLVWDDPETGLRCKARADWLHVAENRALLLDLKTCADAGEFHRSIVRYSYHQQMAHYARGVEILTGLVPEVWVCAIETTNPFGHKVAPMDPDTLELGLVEVDRLLSRVADCMSSGTWPNYEHPDAWRLPEWYTRRTSDPVELVMEDGETVVV